ncbi:sortase, SrtB family [Lancefieldella parvula DSM 20469]|uniref:Sortase, SrtB family n=1 Tax=Lancefieldella parvula (strain ATCC 33793 / DSM 20469 / CCUG 32760 / JCM 10300 / KCTC 3663 / VPI 0546 / 1246) TaxID=521095 RepID=C8W8N3_LANP1|nr:class B sortase [Lancefieldella parvula]ACV50471.1 sortase, SrtB family [Lancefieldella parvula DSM 20469]
MESRNGKHFSSFAAADQPAEDNEVLKTSVEMIPMKSMVSSKKDSNKKKPGSKPAKKGFSNILSTILLIVGIALLIAAAIMFGKTQVDYYAQDVINQELAAYTTVPEKKDEAPVVDWAGLKAVNSQVVGWIQIPGSQINYPVYQTTDNEYYLHTNAKGEWSIGGQIFMDYENNPNGLIDQQTILYGHHMRNGSMFQFIGALNDQNTFNKVETIWYVTPTQTYELEPIFTYHTDEDDDEVRQFNFTSVDEFRSYLKDRLSRAVSSRSDAAEVISRTEHVLTLFTCNYTDQYGRTMLICVPKSEAQPKTQ